MKRLMILAVMVLGSSLAIAKAGDFGVGNGGDGLELSFDGARPLGAPTELPGSRIRYSDLKAVWDQGLPLSEKVLLGRWRLVAFTTTKSCAYAGPDTYNPNGIETTDGSIPTLEFKRLTKTVDDFTGAPPIQVFAVNLLNLSPGSSQGPYPVNPLAPQFSQWGYTNDDLDRDVYFEYSCRGVSKAENRIVCALALRSLQKENLSSNTLACGRENYGHMVGFAKE